MWSRLPDTADVGRDDALCVACSTVRLPHLCKAWCSSEHGPQGEDQLFLGDAVGVIGWLGGDTQRQPWMSTISKHGTTLTFRFYLLNELSSSSSKDLP